MKCTCMPVPGRADCQRGLPWPTSARSARARQYRRGGAHSGLEPSNIARLRPSRLVMIDVDNPGGPCRQAAEWDRADFCDGTDAIAALAVQHDQPIFSGKV